MYTRAIFILASYVLSKWNEFHPMQIDAKLYINVTMCTLYTTPESMFVLKKWGHIDAETRTTHRLSDTDKKKEIERKKERESGISLARSLASVYK